jgi:PAS domain-containing protein
VIVDAYLAGDVLTVRGPKQRMLHVPVASLPALRKLSPAELRNFRIDMLRRFGYYSTESNGHLSEYVPWYRKRPEEIEEWIDLGSWINGETGGYLRVCTEGRNWFETDFPNWMEGPPQEYSAEKRSEEHGSYIIEGLETGRVYRGHFNVVNDGVIANLPADAVIEAPGYVDRNGISMPGVGDLPPGCAAVCNVSISVQRLAVEAAPSGMVLADSGGRIVLVNAQAEKLFGYGREELYGRSIEILVPGRFRETHPRFREQYAEKPRQALLNPLTGEEEEQLNVGSRN